VAIASMILGIVALFAWLIPILGLPVSIVGLVLGIIATAKDMPNKGMAIAGIVMGTLGCIGSITMFFLGLWFMMFI